MKLALCSDLHLEFGNLVLDNTENAEVLILSGDICVARVLPFLDSHSGQRFREFFSQCANRFSNVVMVAGNHESYNGDIATTNKILKDAVKEFNNFHVLEKECVKIGDIIFIGATLWTDMNERQGHTINVVGRMMNDFRLIKNSNAMVSYKAMDSDGTLEFKERPSTFSTLDAIKEHEQTLDYIHHVVSGKDDQKFVVVGHHAPSKLSTHPSYADDTIMNGGYSSNLSQFILDNPQIKLWTHGHTHHLFDYVIGETRIVCNPRGYVGHEQSAVDFKLMFIDVE